MQEAAGEEPVPLAFGDRRRRRSPKSTTSEPPGCSSPPRPAGDLDQEDDDVDRDQDEGRRACAEPADAAAGAPHHFGPLPHALRAAHPDRRRGHAVGADRPPAGGAGDAGLAVGMAVAGLGHREGSLQSAARWTAPAPPGSTRPWSAPSSSSPGSSASSTAPRSAAPATVDDVLRDPRRQRLAQRPPHRDRGDRPAGRRLRGAPVRALAGRPLPRARGLGLRHRQRRRRSSASSPSTPATTSSTWSSACSASAPRSPPRWHRGRGAPASR